jgi:peptidyl-prolyl cis-trans isomerase SurA
MSARMVRIIAGTAALAVAGAALAQTVPDNAVPDSSNLNIPENLQIFGKVDPNIRKPTAIINGSVITGTDVDQRAALTAAFNQYSLSQLTEEQRNQLRFTVLRGLIDETLQVQEAKAHDITITDDELNQAFERVARNTGKSTADFRAWLRTVGASERSVRHQIEGELAWQRYLRRKVDPTINVSDEEVAAIIHRLEASKGTDEYHLREIYISATPDRAQTVFASMQQMMKEMQTGKAPFDYYARTYSETTTKATGGDLGWVRGDVLPAELATAASQMQIGQMAGPIEIPGGFDVLYLVDKRKVLEADQRDSRLSLKQITVKFPAGTTEAQAQSRVAEFAKVTQTIKGCGDVNKVAASINAEVVDNDQITVRDLPGPLQTILLQLQIGQASPPFGSPQEGVRTLVICDRAPPANGGLPSADQLKDKIQSDRVNLRANVMMRDLRRDAIIEYR